MFLNLPSKVENVARQVPKTFSSFYEFTRPSTGFKERPSVMKTTTKTASCYDLAM